MSGVLDVLNSPWAITKEKLQQMAHIYRRRAAGGGPDLEALEKALSEKTPRADLGDGEDAAPSRLYRVIDGVAIVEMDGVLVKRASYFASVSGMTSTQLIQAAFLQAMNDSNVQSIILAIDSPGGNVDGTQLLSDTIRAQRGKGKPIYAIANGQMCSAAYWIGSAADKVYIADQTTVIGSIGVVCTHVDTSKAEEMDGVKVTEITAGKYKRVASQHEPLSDAGRKSIQDMVDSIYTIMVHDIALNRRVTEEQVLAMADGKVYMGQEGIDVGLADGYSTLPALVMTIGNSMGGDNEASAGGNGAASDEGGEGKPADAAGSASPPSGEPAEAGDEKTESDSPKAATPIPNAATSGDGGNSMSDPKVYTESQLREKLALAENENLDEVLTQMGSTHKTLADGEQPDVVGYYELARVEAKLKASERRVFELQGELSTEKEARQQDALKRRAMLVCEKGQRQGRLTKKQIDAWALRDAMKDPEHFEKVVLPSMPRMYSTEHDDDNNHGDSRGNSRGKTGGGEDDVRLDATNAYRERIKDMIAGAKANGKTMTRLEAANKIAADEPEIADAYLKESRAASNDDE